MVRRFDTQVRGDRRAPGAVNDRTTPVRWSEMRFAPAADSRAARAALSGPRRRVVAVRRVRVDFQRYRQSQSAEQPEGLGRQIQSEGLADEHTDVKLGYAAAAAELLQECV